MVDTTTTPERSQADHHRVQEILNDLVAAKRAAPGDDLTSGLIAAREEDGATLTEDELVNTLFLVIAAGFETTVNPLTTPSPRCSPTPTTCAWSSRVNARGPTWSTRR
ncbi:hypothetical protein [Saccharothrix sp. NRRL B-16314]|uniref:hypothetical protein n=1 Tax=Saccharothrix sp. NRRL B-16314 TaxID=1463825 RepID=UPI002F359A35